MYRVMSARVMPSQVAVAAKTVLVADDTAFVRDRFRVALQSSGHVVAAVSTGSELLFRARPEGANRSRRARPSTAAGAGRRASSALFAASRGFGRRSSSSAAPSPTPRRCASSGRSACPATSTSTAPFSTLFRPWHRTFSPMRRTAGRAPGSSLGVSVSVPCGPI